MSHHPHHAAGRSRGTRTNGDDRRVHLGLLAVLAPLLLSAVGGMVWLWPSGEAPQQPGLDTSEAT